MSICACFASHLVPNPAISLHLALALHELHDSFNFATSFHVAPRARASPCGAPSFLFFMNPGINAKPITNLVSCCLSIWGCVSTCAAQFPFLFDQMWGSCDLDASWFTCYIMCHPPGPPPIWSPALYRSPSLPFAPVESLTFIRCANPMKLDVCVKWVFHVKVYNFGAQFSSKYQPRPFKWNTCFGHSSFHFLSYFRHRATETYPQK